MEPVSNIEEKDHLVAGFVVVLYDRNGTRRFSRRLYKVRDEVTGCGYRVHEKSINLVLQVLHLVAIVPRIIVGSPVSATNLTDQTLVIANSSIH